MNLEKLGQRIQYFRSQRGISQASLSEKVFVNHEYISRIENGKKAISLELLISIADALEVSADDLIADSLKYGSHHVPPEAVVLFQQCSKKETQFLLRLLEFTKKLLDETGI